MLHALIMAGGGGTRFWPRSRAARPKQFLTLTGDRSLLQQACDRLEAQVPAEHTWVITAAQHRSEAEKQLPHLPAEQVVGEPTGRDTAPCIALGAALIARRDPAAVMVVTPADHVIEPTAEFQRAVRAAAQVAEEHPDALITFGIPPTFPATGYGYIHRGPEVARRQGVPVYQVAAFREKPAADVAERFVASGEYFWNSGIFVWKVSAI
ncbi:MAG TPA: sugar phosphate nucleotidyltransferase, partial [Gemmataceae bacterium]